MSAWGVPVGSPPGSPDWEDLDDERAIEAETRAMREEEQEPEPESEDEEEQQQPQHTRSGVRRSSVVRDDDEEEEAGRASGRGSGTQRHAAPPPPPPRARAGAQVEPPRRPGLQPKLHSVLHREAIDVESGIGTFARAEAQLLMDGETYNWAISPDAAGFDGAGTFLAERMRAVATKATEGTDHHAFISHESLTVTALETEQPMLKQLPDAPRGFDENASDLVVVTGGGRYLYRNEIHADGTIVPAAYAMCDPSEALLCSTAKMVFTTTEMVCPCEASSTNHAVCAKFDATTGTPMVFLEHKAGEDAWAVCSKQANGWAVSATELGRVLQVSTWPEHDVRALQAKNVKEFVAPFETEVAALAMFDTSHKTTILVDLLDAKLGDAIVKCGAVNKPALFTADVNTRMWSVTEISQSTLIDNQIDLICNTSMAMDKRDNDELQLIVQRLKERHKSTGWPDYLKPPPKKGGGGGGGDDDEEDGEEEDEDEMRLKKLREGLQHPHLRTWYDNVALHQNHTRSMLLKRVAHRGLGPKRDISPFDPPLLLPFSDGQLVDFAHRRSGGLVRRIEQTDLLTKTLPFALKELDSSSLPDLDMASEAQVRAFGKQLGDEEATIKYWQFMKLYFNYEGGVMYRLSVVAKALVGDTFHSALYVQLGARKQNGAFIQGAGKGMPSKLDQDALGAYAESCPLALLFYKEKVDGASPGFAKLEAKRYVLIDEANQQQNNSGGDQVINPNMLRRLVPQGPETKLSARQLYEGHLDFNAQIISLNINLNNMYAGLMDGRRVQAIHLSTVFLPGDEYDRWVAAEHDPNVLSAKWRDSVIAVVGEDGSAKRNVQKKANGNPYDATMWKRMSKVHLTCATLLARRCVKTDEWPAVPKVNEELTNQLLQEEANRTSLTAKGIDAATMERLGEAWHEFAVPCETELKGGKSTVPHACKCTRDGHERWCVLGVDAFITWLSATDKTLARAVQSTKGSTHVIDLLKQAVPGLETAHCDKAGRAPAGTLYAKERPRNAIVRWRAKSEGAPNAKKKQAKQSVARVDKPAKRKLKAMGAEKGKAKKQQKLNIHTSKSDLSDDADNDDSSESFLNSDDEEDSEEEESEEGSEEEGSEEEESEEEGSEEEESQASGDDDSQEDASGDESSD